jgi:hypothetical protein
MTYSGLWRITTNIRLLARKLENSAGLPDPKRVNQ